MKKTRYIEKKEKWGYGFAALGQGAIYAMMSAWIVRYYTDVLVLPALFITALMWGARIWDAINDPIMGAFIDKTRTRFGKMRVYLLITPIPIAVFTVLLFFNPNLNPTGTMIYAAVTYVLWGMIYTISDVPFWGLPSAMTPCNEERANFLSLSRTLNGIGGALPLVLVAVLTSQGMLGQQNGFLVSAIVFAVGGTLLFGRTFFVTRERIAPSKEIIGFKENFSLIKINKPLLIAIVFGILCFGRYMVQGAISYAADYVFTSSIEVLDNNKVLICSALVGIGMFPAMLLMPTLFKKFNYKQIGIGSGIFSFIIGCLFYIVAVATQYNLIIALPFLLLMGMPLGVFNILTFAIIADSIDYLEWKTGKRTEGVSFACQTFINKFGAAISAGLIPLMLGLINYVAPINDVLQDQPENAVKGILAMITIIPAISMFISIIPMFFYDFIGENKKNILSELNNRHEVS